jgi:phosphate uptake regulator
MVTYDELTPMAILAARQVRDVVMALVDIDEARAREVAERDDEIDRLYHQVFDDVLREMRTDPAKVDPGTRILFAAHYLERIGDRVTNIAEDVVFLATGEVEDLNPKRVGVARSRHRGPLLGSGGGSRSLDLIASWRRHPAADFHRGHEGESTCLRALCWR